MQSELLEHLSPVRDPGTLAGLFQCLGYEPCVQELANGNWLIARYRSFRVVANFGRSSEAVSRKLVREFSSGPERVLAAGVGGGAISLCTDRIGAPGTTRILSVSTSSPTLFELQQLRLLKPDEHCTSLAHALRVADVLDSEPAGDRFFTAFRDVFSHMCDAAPEGIDNDTTRTLVFISLTRVLFLYFVQARGWLNGDQNFLRSLFDKTVSHGRHFHTEALQPLFFATLNTPHWHRETNSIPGCLPYLNGGLFVKHPLELEHPEFKISNELWRDALDDLFEKFRFCSSESSDPDAIAPDMLGRVFERLGALDRKRTGTYYTPETIVDRVVRATLSVALADLTGLTQDRIQTVVKGGRVTASEKSAVLRAARAIKILDPAVGSGAFLMSALTILTSLRIRCGEQGSVAHLKREVMRDNLFGVDIDPMAVRLAELRLWLAIASEEKATEPEDVEPLPNLDGVLRQGDSLLDPAFAIHARGQVVDQLASARTRLFSARGSTRDEAVQQIRAGELHCARELLTNELASLQRELSNSSRDFSLFEERESISDKAARRERLEHLRHLLALVDRGELPFFSYNLHCPDVIDSGGFDIVTGNPPWVRAESLEPRTRTELRKRFAWWKGSASRGYAHQPDLSVAFLQRAIELCKEGGAIGLLLPSKIATAAYAATARKHVVAETRIAYLEKFSEKDGKAFGATAYPMTLVLNKRAAVEHLDAGPTSGGPWVMSGKRDSRAISEFLALGESAASVVTPGLGVKTGADRFFIGELVEQDDNETTLKLAGREVTIERSLVRPAIRGRDVRRFGYRARRLMLWCHDENGRPMRKLPPLAEAYFEAIRKKLLARSDYRSGPPWTVFRTAAGVSRRPIIWADLSMKSRVAVGDGIGVPLNTCYHATPVTDNLTYALCCVFNSTWTNAVAKALADEARGGYRRFNARLISMLPVPMNSECIARLALLGKRAVNEDVEDDEIDDAVAEALGVSRQLQARLRDIAHNSS